MAIYVAATCFNILSAFAEDAPQVERLPLGSAIAAVTSTPTLTPTPAPASTPTPTLTPTPEPTLTPAEADTAAPATPDPPPVTPQPTATASPSPAPNDLIAWINAARAANGLSPLAPNAALMDAASSYARTMAEYNWFSHAGPDGSTYISRIEAAAYTGWAYVGEVLFTGPTSYSPAQVVDAWLNEPSHRAVVLSAEATEVGAACYVSGDSQWCVAEFGDR